jgi:hypothetical protein
VSDRLLGRRFAQREPSELCDPDLGLELRRSLKVDAIMGR